MKEFDPESIAEFDGKDGKPVYVVHRDRVFDVSESKLWKGGLHMKRHHAGKDMTTDIQAAPHGPEVLERYPQVGVVGKKTPPEESGESAGFLMRLLRKYPFLRRHPHPMTVHFPIAFMLAVPVFNILYLITGIRSFEITSVHCLGAGLLFTPLVMLTGLFTWWLNYMAKPLKPVNVKLTVSILMLITSVTAFTWRAENPHLMDSFGTAGILYFLLTLSLIPMVSVIGWYGAKLTFPIERD